MLTSSLAAAAIKAKASVASIFCLLHLDFSRPGSSELKTLHFQFRLLPQLLRLLEWLIWIQFYGLAACKVLNLVGMVTACSHLSSLLSSMLHSCLLTVPCLPFYLSPIGDVLHFGKKSLRHSWRRLTTSITEIPLMIQHGGDIFGPSAIMVLETNGASMPSLTSLSAMFISTLRGLVLPRRSISPNQECPDTPSIWAFSEMADITGITFQSNTVIQCRRTYTLLRTSHASFVETKMITSIRFFAIIVTCRVIFIVPLHA